MKFTFREKYYKYFPYIFTLIFIIPSILLIINHEFWFDEIHAWNIALESNSLSEVFGAIRVGHGTPALWHTLLYFISHNITTNVEVVKIIHLTISTLTAFLILKHAPFNKTIKIMLVFGYFFFYEYSIISRNYAIGVFLITLFCVLYRNKYNRILQLGAILFFLGQANAFAFMISLCLFTILLTDLIKNYRDHKINKLLFLFFILIFLVEIFVFLWQILPQAESGMRLSLSNKIENYFISFSYPDFINQFLENLIKAFIPIPRIAIDFWNNSLLIDLISTLRMSYKIILSSLLLIFPIFVLKKRIIAPYLFGVLLINIGLFLYKDPIRLTGHIFILFIACLWISNSTEDGGFILMLKRDWVNVVKNLILYILLLTSLVGSGIAFYYDYKYPFSTSKKAAEYIEQNFDLNNTVIIGIPSAPTETIAGYLNKDFYYPQDQRFGRRTKWIDTKKVTIESLGTDLARLKKDNKDNDILIIKDKYGTLSTIISDDILYFYQFEKIEHFQVAIVPNEVYSLFLLNQNLKFDLIEKSNLRNFKKNWKNINNIEFNLTKDNQLLIKPISSDPNFESNFPIPRVENDKKLYLRLDINTDNESYLELYYKKDNSQYNEKDKIQRHLNVGLNYLLIKIENPQKIAGIRIDPVNTRTECIIKKVEFYEFSN